MVRTTIAQLLIAVVLLSPHLCLRQAAGDTRARGPTAGCSCCKVPTDRDSEPSESPEDRDPDCLCRGAILESVCSDVEEPAICVVHLGDSDNTRQSLAICIARAARQATCHDPPIRTGRDLCALICALLL